MDEPESLGAISLGGREKLDNLIFVINCNLQRLDGPVRGNGKIIQELEGIFRGAGWNVIKVIWGTGWDRLIAADKTGLLLKRMEECVDGEYQDFKSKNGAYVRQHFFGKYPELLDLVADMSDDDIWALNRGGHDPQKVYAAYHAAVNHTDQPTVILAKTVKGYGMGEAGEGQNITHQQKKMGETVLRAFRDRFRIDVPDERIPEVPFLPLAEGGSEHGYLHERRTALGGYLPARRRRSTESLQVPPLSAFETQLKGTGDREISTTMAFVRILTTLLRDKQIGKRIVPIVPDESRTFGGEPLPPVQDLLPGRAAVPAGRRQPADVLQGGQVRPAAAGGDQRAGSDVVVDRRSHVYSTNDTPMIPFYIYYSMFGFQRVGDLAWAAGDMRSRGFLLGGTAGRTTLQRRGTAARGRAQPPDVLDNSELRLL